MPGIATSTVTRSVTPIERPDAIWKIAPVIIAAGYRAQEGADDARPEAIREEDREVPQRDARS